VHFLLQLSSAVTARRAVSHSVTFELEVTQDRIDCCWFC